MSISEGATTSNVLHAVRDRARLQALAAAEIFDSPSEPQFDAIGRLAADICGVPIALVTFVDATRQWTKASCGLVSAGDVSVETAFCAHVVGAKELFEICDARLDERFANNPLVTGEPFIRFYAGAPIMTESGHALGALCAIDRVPHRLSDSQRRQLTALAAVVSDVVEARLNVPRAARQRIDVLSEAIEHTGAPLMILANPSHGEPARCTYVNRSFVDLFDIDAARIVGRVPSEIFFGPRTDRRIVSKIESTGRRGEPIQVEIVLYGGDGAAHVVEMQRRPIPAGDGTIACWVLTFRDLTEQRAAAHVLAQQSERMRALYLITSMRGMTGYRQVDSVLKLGLQCLDLDYGFVAQCDDEQVTILNSVGTDRIYEPGKTVPLRETWLRDALTLNDVQAFQNLRDPKTRPEGARTYSDWGAYIVAPITIGADLVGAIGFLGRTPRDVPFPKGDCEFVRLMGSYVGPSIERKFEKEKLDALAFYDALTGLCNRAMLFERLEIAVRRARTDGSHLAILYIDLDGFKAVNDSLGHAAGDRVLTCIAERLRANVRDGDIVARIGGDEFVVVQTDIEIDLDAQTLARRLIEAIREPIAVGEPAPNLGASIGIAVHSIASQSVDDLLHAADRALYNAKANGKGTAFMAAGSEIAEAQAKARRLLAAG